VARGAVLAAPGSPALVEDIEVAGPEAGEVLVRLVASGVCHTDRYVMEQGGWGHAYPILLGHEGAGVVEAAGAGVEDVAVGDRVVVSYRAPCGSCAACARGDARRCQRSPVAGPRLRRASTGEVLTPVLRTGTLATHTVVPAAAVVRMPDAMPLDRACLLACAVVTGVGAVLNTSPIWQGARVAVVGCGAVGLNVVQGARIAGAGQVVAVDRDSARLEAARAFGATDLVEAGPDVVRAVKRATGGGADFAYEAVGLPETLDAALRMLALDGTATLIGLPPADAAVALGLVDEGARFFQKSLTLRCCNGGHPLPREDLPRLASLYLAGELLLDELVTREIGLDEVGEALGSEDAIRTVVRLDRDDSVA
jgi:Zn-dependent alcohol dehydrogenase